MHEYYRQLLHKKDFTVPEDKCIKICVYITKIRSLSVITILLLKTTLK